MPAVKAVRFSVTTGDGTGEGNLIWMRDVPGGDVITPDFEAGSGTAFGKSIESIRDRYRILTQRDAEQGFSIRPSLVPLP